MFQDIDANTKKWTTPVECSEYWQLAGDPSILKDGSTYRIFCTGLDKAIMGGGMCEATSTDGFTWTLAPKGNTTTGLGLVLRGRSNTWEHQLETANAIKQGSTYFLYYSAYPQVGWPTNPGQLGVATSTDGINFARIGTTPILAPTRNGYDTNGLYSPSVIYDNNQFVMVYAGHCYASYKVVPGIRVMGATSTNGKTWTKRSQPVLSPSSQRPWMVNGVAEPCMIKDGSTYYLFFTGGLGDNESRVIGLGRSASPWGPWDIRPDPVLTGTPGHFDASGVLAPSVLIENGKVKMWYLVNDGDTHMTAYAEILWPIFT